jgi:RHS repeat-associated protein
MRELVGVAHRRGGCAVRRSLPLSWVAVVVVLALAAYVGIDYIMRSNPTVVNSAPTGAKTAAEAYFHPQPEPALRTTVSVAYGAAGTAPSATAPFAECPGVGADTGCGALVQITGSATARIVADLGQGPYDGGGGTLIGVLNDSDRQVSSLDFSADEPLFSFGTDGLCAAGFHAAANRTGCASGAAGYEGPGTTFTGVSGNGQDGTVSFAQPLAPGASAYFALAQAPAANHGAAAPTAAEQGGAANPSIAQAACSTAGAVDCATGELSEQYTDIDIPGRGPGLELTRSYDSAAATAGAGPFGAPFGPGWTFSYGMTLTQEADGSVVVAQENGSTVDFTQTSSGRYTAAPWERATLTARSDGSFAFLRRSDRLTFVFADNGVLDSISDLDGDTTTLTYQNGELYQVADSSGRTLTFTWSGNRITRVTDPLNRTITYAYNPNGDLQSVKDRAGFVWDYAYGGPDGLLSSIADPAHGLTAFSYTPTAPHAVVEQSGPEAGAVQQWAYTGDAASAGGGRTTATDAVGDTTVYDFADLQLTAMTEGAGTGSAATTSYTYDPAVDLTSQTDPDGDVTQNSYNPGGDLVSTTDPLHRTTAYTYDQYGDVLTETTPLHETTRWQYDANGNLLSETDPLGDQTVLTHSGTEPADVTLVKYPQGNGIQYAYDAYGDVDSTTDLDPGGKAEVTDDVYDADGELVCEASPAATASNVDCPTAGSGHTAGTTAYTYDGDGQQASEIAGSGQTSTTRYLWNGFLESSTDPAGHRSAYTYNGLFQATRATTGSGSEASVTSKTTYYPDGLVHVETDGQGRTTTYQYSATGEAVEVATAGGATRYTYDHAGRLASSTAPDGTVTDYTYDADGEQTGESYSAGPGPATPAVHSAYDADGHRISMADGTGTTLYRYDAAGRLQETVDGAGQQVSYAYDRDGDVQRLTYPNGRTVGYTYNGAEQLQSVTDWLGDKTSFTYDASGSVQQEQYPGGVTAAYGTEQGSAAKCADSQATATTVVDQRGSTQLASSTECLDADSLVTSATTSVASFGSAATQNTNTTYTYNASNQLASVDGHAVRYNGDGGSTELAGSSQTFSGDELDQSTSTTAANGGDASSGSGSGSGSSSAAPAAATTAYKFNADGDRISATGPSGTTTLAYNGADELVGDQTANPATSSTFTYNGDGLRATATSGGSTSTFAWDLAQTTPDLLSNGADSYVYGPGNQPIEQIHGDTATFLLDDQQGDTRLLTAADGTVLASYAYSAFGAATQTTAADTGDGGDGGSGTAAALTPLLYQGQYTDADGLVYLRARYYDPSTDQFLTPDPFTSATGDPYGFAEDDPVNGTDPSGLICLSLSCLAGDAISMVSGASVVGSLLTVAWVFGGQAITNDATDAVRWVTDNAETLSEIAQIGSYIALFLAAVALMVPGVDLALVPVFLGAYEYLDRVSMVLDGIAAVHDATSGDVPGAATSSTKVATGVAVAKIFEHD